MRRAPTPATPRCSPTRSSRSSAPRRPSAGAAARERRQRAALRHGLPADPRAGPVLPTPPRSSTRWATAPRPPPSRSRCSTLEPPAAEAQRRVAWTVLAHTSFEGGAFDSAEKDYAEVLKLTPENDAGAQRPGRAPGRVDLQAGRAGARRRPDARRRRRTSTGSRPWRRSRRCAPTAQYDAAAALIVLKDWDSAIAHARGLPHPLPEPRAPGRGQRQARRRLPREGPVGAAPPASSSAWPRRSPDPKIARDALWQAAELYEKAERAADGGQGLRALPRSSTRSRSSRPSRRAGASRSSPRPTATRRARPR